MSVAGVDDHIQLHTAVSAADYRRHELNDAEKS